MNWQWTSIQSINELSKVQFDALIEPNSSNSPFLQYAFLSAFEETHCVGKNTGWTPAHIVIKDNQQSIVAFLPAYIKTHSYGEYVFDHSWAHAYEQHGLAYYPKLIVALPFTPVTSARILLSASASLDEVIGFVGSVKQALIQSLNVSSIHLLFVAKDMSAKLDEAGFHQRLSVQFNWHNNAYHHYDDFMATLTARRRRSIRKERSAIAKQGVTVERVVADQISTQQMDFFYHCYQQTYLKRSGHTGYLNHAFFKTLLHTMPNNLMLVIAHKPNSNDSKSTDHPKDNTKDISIDNNTSTCDTPVTPYVIATPIAAALFLFDTGGLYGRYWGAIEEVSGLHFEACYYQGIEFCIERALPLFNPGTQGEHKILRGFAPTLCYSHHKMQDPAFDQAVSDFLMRESPHIIDYAKKSASLLPYKDNEEAD